MSSRELENEVDRTRAAMDRTLDAIAGKLTPQQLMVEALGAFREGSSTLATKLVETAREHPVPATVIGLGVAMLLSESRSSGDGSSRGTMDTLREKGGDARTAASYGVHRVQDATMHAAEGVRESASHMAENVRETAAEAAERLRQKQADLRDRASNLVGAVGERASSVADAVGERASSLAGAVTERAHNVSERATEVSERLGSRLHDTADSVRQSAAQVPGQARQKVHDAQLGFWQYMDRSPLAVGAAALAAGVAAGLTVPSTRREDEWMGRTRDGLLEQAQDRVQGVRSEVMEKGRNIARTAADVARTEAERQGLTPAALVDKLKAVTRETENAVKSEASRAVPDSLKG